MKKIISAILIFDTIGLTNSFGQNEMAKMKENAIIEKAAKSLEGVSKAYWNKEKKYMMISYDNTKTNLTSVYNAIAASVYDTESVNVNSDGYNNLADFCKYNLNRKMNQSKEENPHIHNVN